MGLTLDDLRQPGFGGRVWGYDRDEVDQLLASVVTSIERLQRRRQRDAASIDKAKAEAAEATERAERTERERDELAIRLELALEGADHEAGRGWRDDDRTSAFDVPEAQRLEDERREDERQEVERQEVERLVAEAEERAAQAERQMLGLREEVAQQRARTPMPDLEPEAYARLPLAQRAARALLRDARARAAAIVAEAEERASVSP